MDRLRCGVIYTTEFASFLHRWWMADPHHHADRIPSLDFVHCKDGPRAGESWVSLSWVFRKGLPDHELFEISGIQLHLPRQSQKGLKWRCLDAKNGRMVVVGG